MRLQCQTSSLSFFQHFQNRELTLKVRKPQVEIINSYEQITSNIGLELGIRDI